MAGLTRGSRRRDRRVGKTENRKLKLENGKRVDGAEWLAPILFW